MTSALREKFRRAGANAGLLAALDKAESNFRNRDKRETIELAKSEAKVVWYSSLQSPLPEELCSRFNSKNFGINCVVHRSGSGNLYRRWREEAKSGINQADILHTSNIDDFVRLRNEGALFRYRPEGIEKFNSSFVEKDGHWAVLRGGVYIPAYNTIKVRKNDVPKSWLEFFDGRWGGGKLIIGDPISSGFVNVGLAALVKQFGWQFFDKLAAQYPRISLSSVDAMNQLKSGEASMMFAGIGYSLYQEISNRAPMDYIFPKEGLPFIPSPQAILANAQHPNAARVFTDWLFTNEAQQILANKGHYVGHPAVEYPREHIPLKDLTLIKVPQEEPSATYQQVRDEFRKKFLRLD